MPSLLESPWNNDETRPIIAIVEDNDEDFYAFVRAIRSQEALRQMLSNYTFLRFHDGDEALDYLMRGGNYEGLKAPLPIFILLDLNLPGTDGREIIRQVKQNPNLQILPMIVLTSSASPSDIQTCYRYGVNSYLLKPMGVSTMQQTVQTLFQYWFQFAVLPSYGQVPI
ncbi:response regulator [Tumidithrix elongata RA019]|uniref:Response regulator n=1 Tax=Tumidithrix elongata BACA0141 TaxID=2716417 RepID=A0AAW9PWU8_9CYAN|nr:response regulator [Tumidithrix elongata RA019]